MSGFGTPVNFVLWAVAAWLLGRLHGRGAGRRWKPLVSETDVSPLYMA